MANQIGDSDLWDYSTEGAGDANFGVVIDEIPASSADLIPFPIYATTSDETDVDDMGGVVFNLLVRIEKVSSTTAKMATFIAALFGLHNGQQEKSQGYPLTYASNLYGSRKMKILRIDGLSGVSTSPAQLVLQYSISFIESSDI